MTITQRHGLWHFQCISGRTRRAHLRKALTEPCSYPYTCHQLSPSAGCALKCCRLGKRRCCQCQVSSATDLFCTFHDTGHRRVIKSLHFIISIDMRQCLITEHYDAAAVAGALQQMHVLYGRMPCAQALSLPRSLVVDSRCCQANAEGGGISSMLFMLLKRSSHVKRDALDNRRMQSCIPA